MSSIASRYNVPLVITSHGTDILGYKSWARFHNYCEEAIKNSKAVITISHSNNKEVLKLFSNVNGKNTCILNGYDSDIFYNNKNIDKKEILKSYGIEKEYKNIVLFSGRLVKVKGVDFLLEAAKIYEDENILTIISGAGVLRKKLENKAKELNLKNVVFIGNQKQINLSKLYNIADLTVLSSRYEGLALVVLESLACGTPVVAVDIDAMKEFMKDEFGIVVPKENPQELARGIKELLATRKNYNSQKIAEYMKKNYSQDVLIDKTLEVYKNVIKNK